jgi:hypothetical protein
VSEYKTGSFKFIKEQEGGGEEQERSKCGNRYVLPQGAIGGLQSCSANQAGQNYGQTKSKHKTMTCIIERTFCPLVTWRE